LILQTQYPSCDAAGPRTEFPAKVIFIPYTVLKAVITEHLPVKQEKAREGYLAEFL
jgi:hypothetical protein